MTIKYSEIDISDVLRSTIVTSNKKKLRLYLLQDDNDNTIFLDRTKMRIWIYLLRLFINLSL